ncbi:MAG: hypothetical protein ACRENQ_05735 [Gemmatimonadaceae bacterium]
MGAVALIVVLAGMVFPIVLLLATVLFDLGVLAWAGYRFGHDHWTQMLGHRVHHTVASLASGHPGLHGRAG